MENFAINMDILKGMDTNEGNSVRWARCLNGMTFRVMMPWSSKGQIWKEVHSHRIEMPMGKFTRYEWICNQKTSGSSCKICDTLAALRTKGFNVDLSTTRSYYVNAIITGDPSGTYQSGTLVVLRMPFQGIKTIQEFILNPMIGNFLGVSESGADLICKKEGQGITTKYSFNISPSGRQALQGVDNITLYDLDEVLKGESEDDINQLIQYISGDPTRAMNMKDVNSLPFSPNSSTTISTPNNATPQINMGTPQANIIAPQINIPMQASVPNVNQPTGIQNVPPVAQQSVQTPATSSVSGKPDCFGNYKPGEINCILCQYEVMCKSNK